VFFLNRKELKKLVTVAEQKADKPFCDVSRLLKDATAFKSACGDLESLCKKLGGYDLILSPDGLGLVFGAAIATTHQSGFVPALKLDTLPKRAEDDAQVKLHEVRCQRGKTKVDTLWIQEGMIKPGQRIIIVDDILASGATTLGLARTVREMGGEIVGVVTLVEMTPRHGKQALEAFGYQVRSVLRIGG
jgi:adenine phosphoribosyltransferase